MKYPNVKLQMKSIDSNSNDITTTIGYCNPNASDATLKEFAEKLNEFTTNTFLGIYKISTEDIYYAEGYPYTISAIQTSYDITIGGGSETIVITANIPEDERENIEWTTDTEGNLNMSSIDYFSEDNQYKFHVSTNEGEARTVTLEVYALDGTMQASNKLTFTINIKAA